MGSTVTGVTSDAATATLQRRPLPLKGTRRRQLILAAGSDRGATAFVLVWVMLSDLGF